MTPVYRVSNYVAVNQTTAVIGYILNTNNSSSWNSDYTSTIDPYNMGKTFGKPRRSLVGATYNTSTNNGSRSMNCSINIITTDKSYTARGCNYALYYLILSILSYSK